MKKKSRIKKRRVCVVTGSRADFGIIQPVLEAIRRSRKLELSLLATAMHLSPEFGMTIREIEAAGFAVDARVDMSVGGDSNAAMAKSIGAGILGMVNAFEKLKPDICLIPVDRAEDLAAAAAAATMNIFIAHMNGGDVSGSIDESYRHAITQFAHAHFPNCASSARRLIRMGQRKDRVFMVGHAGLDNIRPGKIITGEKIRAKYGLSPRERFLVAVYHPISTESGEAGHQMDAFLSALDAGGMRTILLSPNADAGGRSMLARLKTVRSSALRSNAERAGAARSSASRLNFYSSLPHKDYVALLAQADALVGNSSSGILEAPSLKLPVVNIGNRQQGRERASNVLDVRAAKQAILSGIRKATEDKVFIRRARACANPYGDGHASDRIVRVLENISLDPRGLQKRMAY